MNSATHPDPVTPCAAGLAVELRDALTKVKDLGAELAAEKIRAAKLEAQLSGPAPAVVLPERYPCWSCAEPVTLAERAEEDGDCPHCGVELDLSDWPAKKSAAALPMQAETEVYAIRYLSHWDGEGDEVYVLAWKHNGELVAHEGGGKISDLLEYKGDRILNVWPLSTHAEHQAEQVPVAWVYPSQLRALASADGSATCAVWNKCFGPLAPLFTSPPAAPAQDVAGLVEALNRIASIPAKGSLDFHPSHMSRIARAALAAYKGDKS